MMSSEKGVSLNIGGGHTDPTALLLAAMNGKNNDGMGSNSIWPILLLVLLGLGRGGLCGNSATEGAVIGAAAAHTHEPAFLQLFNGLCGIGKEVAASATATQAVVNNAADRATASNNLQTQMIDSGFNQTRDAIAANRAVMNAEFINTNNGINSGFVSLAKEMACAFGRQNDNFSNYTRTLDMNLCNNFGKVFLQNSALKCSIEKLEDKVDCNFDKTKALIELSTDKIISSQKELAKDALIAEQAREIENLRSSSHKDAIVNQIIGRLSFNPGNGHGNGNS